MTDTVTAAPVEDTEHRAQLRKAVIAATVGTTIEWYDFFIYGTAAGLVFGKLYFPQRDPLVATLAAFGIYFIGFLGRPIGAAIFGHYGDRIGRKSTLIATLLLMGIATFLVAFVPGYASIGIWGAVMLTLLRLIQGIGVGGEWGGSVLLAMEWARTHEQRGLVASWPQFGVPSGLFLANLAVLAFSGLSGDQFLTWGWRIPFLLSIVLVGIGLWIRLGILETPVFQRLVAETRSSARRSLEVISRQPKEIILSALARMAEQAPFYIFTAFVFSYGTRHAARVARFVPDRGAGRLAACRSSRSRSSGHISDRIGRKRMYLIGAVATGHLRLHLLRAARHRGRRAGLSSPIVLSLIPHDMHVRAAGGADRRILHAAAALQRRVARLSARLDHRRRPGAADRDGAVRRLSFGLRDRGLHRGCAVVSVIAAALMPDYTGQGHLARSTTTRSWQTLEAAAATKAIDVWMLYPTGMGLNRLLTKDGDIPPECSVRLIAPWAARIGVKPFISQIAEIQTCSVSHRSELVKDAGAGKFEAFLLDRLRTIFTDVAPVALPLKIVVEQIVSALLRLRKSSRGYGRGAH